MAGGAMNNINLATAEGRKLLQIQARDAFKLELSNQNATKVAFGASIMPRVLWARCLTLAIFAVDASGNPDAIEAILDSDLGNSSQLGTQLVKEGFITQDSAAIHGESLAQLLAKRAAAKV